MKKKYSFLILIFCVSSLFAQHDETLFGDNFEMSASWAGISYTHSQIQEATINQLGLDVGFEYKGIFLTGYQWRSTINEILLFDPSNNNRIKLDYHTFLLGYTLPSHRVVHPRFTIGIGPGSMRVDEVKDQLFIVQPAAGLEVNLFQWARLSLEGGYRMVSGVQTSGLTNNDLKKFFGTISLKFGWSWANPNTK